MYLNLLITADNTPRAQFAKNGRHNVWKSSTCTAGKLTACLIQPPGMNSYSEYQPKVLFLSNMLPSQIPVHINTHIFCKKNNGMVNNSAAFSFLHLKKCYLHHFSEEDFTEHSFFKDTPLSYSIQSLGFYLQEEFGEKPKPTTKTYHIAIVTWYTAGKAACERSLLLSANPVV